MLKSESRRRSFAGDSDITPAVEVAVVLVVVAEKTERVAELAEEGVGEAARAVRAAGVDAGSRRGTSVRRSPMGSTDE